MSGACITPGWPIRLAKDDKPGRRLGEDFSGDKGTLRCRIPGGEVSTADLNSTLSDPFIFDEELKEILSLKYKEVLDNSAYFDHLLLQY